MVAQALWIEGPGSIGSGFTDARVQALIEAFAERHVALSVDLAKALAELEVSETPAKSRLWGAGFRLAGEAVGQGAILGATRFWKPAVPCFINTVAAPLLRRAMQRCDQVALVGAAPLGSSPSSGPHGGWQTSYQQVLTLLLSDLEEMGTGFWSEAALRLYGAAMQDVQQRRAVGSQRAGYPSVLPEPEPLLTRLLFETEPSLPEAFRTSKKWRRARSKSQRKRSGIRPKEGGVAGLNSSTFIDDLPDALLSELVLPVETVTDRLLHEGLLVRHRPPFREPRRDLLIMTLADRRNARERDAGAVVKAAWADAMMRLQILLVQMGLEKSDLLWSELRPAGISAQAIGAEGEDIPAGLDPLRLSEDLRKMRLFRSDLMPGFVDTLAGDQATAPSETETAQATLAALAQAGLQELATRARLAHVLKKRQSTSEPAPRPRDYAKRIVFVLLAAQGDVAEDARKDWAALRSTLIAALRPKLEADMQVIGILPPADGLARGASFALLGDLLPGGILEVEIDVDAPAQEAMGGLVGALSAQLISLVLEALDV